MLRCGWSERNYSVTRYSCAVWITTRSSRDAVLLTGAIWGPALFLLAWLIGGLLYPGLSPVTAHISALAAVGAPSRLVMTAGQVAMAGGLAMATVPLRRVLGLGAAYCLALAAISLGVIVLTPDGSVPDRGLVHGGFAILLYASLALLGGLAGRHLLLAGARTAGFLAVGEGLAVGIFLWLSLGDTASGLFQRLGFTTASAWLVGVALRRVPVPGR